MTMEIPRKIENEEYELFVKLFKTSLRPNEIIYKMHINEDRYDLLLQYHWYKKRGTKRSSLTRKFEECKRQNIPDGYHPWVSKILGVA